MCGATIFEFIEPRISPVSALRIVLATSAVSLAIPVAFGGCVILATELPPLLCAQPHFPPLFSGFDCGSSATLVAPYEPRCQARSALPAVL